VIVHLHKEVLDDGEWATGLVWMCPCVVCDFGVERGQMVRDGMREMRAQKEEGACIMASCGTKVCLRCWELEPQEGDGGERYEWQGMVVQEEKRVQSEGDEKREEEKSEVQPFGCASTSS
jgi:hypothetical protein